MTQVFFATNSDFYEFFALLVLISVISGYLFSSFVKIRVIRGYLFFIRKNQYNSQLCFQLYFKVFHILQFALRINCAGFY